MKTFRLQIVTPDGECFDGQAERLVVRTNNGDVAIMANHANYVAVLGYGAAAVVTETGRRTAACLGGMLAVNNGEARVIATAFEWAEEIDKDRAKLALEKSEALLADSSLSEASRTAAELAAGGCAGIPSGPLALSADFQCDSLRRTGLADQRHVF